MPLSSTLFLKTHLVPMMLLSPLGLGTNFQTLFLSNSSNSSCIALIQSGSFMASLMFFGSCKETKHCIVHRVCKPDLVLDSRIWLGGWFLAIEELMESGDIGRSPSVIGRSSSGVTFPT